MTENSFEAPCSLSHLQTGITKFKPVQEDQGDVLAIKNSLKTLFEFFLFKNKKAKFGIMIWWRRLLIVCLKIVFVVF